MKVGGDSTGIREIARQAGVSTATVSRVLNGSSKVRADTRERVMSVVQTTRFRPNAAAKALATNRTRTIAAIVPTLEHSIFASFLNAIEDRLAQSGYSLVIGTHGFDPDVELKRFNDLLRLGAEAVIVSGAEHSEEFHAAITAAAIPCLYTSVYEPDQNIPSFGYDNTALAAEAIEFLYQKGHRDIGVIHGPVKNNDRMRLRVEGAEAALQNRGVDNACYQATLSVTGGTNVLRQLCTENKVPTACLCLADVLALGVIFEANRQEIRIPEQLSVMGFENLDWAKACAPALTTIALPAVEMGADAATALIDNLDHGKPLEHRLFSAKIIDRISTNTLERGHKHQSF